MIIINNVNLSLDTDFSQPYKIVAKELKIDKILRIAKRYNIEYSFQKIRFMGSYKNENNEKKIIFIHSFLI